MSQDIVGDEDGDSRGYNQVDKVCYMPLDSVGAEDGDTAAGTSKAVGTATCLRTS